MPEYLAPGVYVEETSFRSKSIEGVGTSTAGFVGPARYGPICGDPELLTSLADFERIYGGLDDLSFSEGQTTNYLAHAVRAFFEEGGKRLYISRVFNFGDGGYSVTAQNGIEVPASGYASFLNLDNSSLQEASPLQAHPIRLIARFPGEAGNIRVTFTLRAGTNALTRKSGSSTEWTLTRVQNYDLVHVRAPGSPSPWTAIGDDGLHLAVWDAKQKEWFLKADGISTKLQDLLASDPEAQIRPVIVTVEVERPKGQGFDVPELQGSFGFDPRSDSGLTATFTRLPSTRFQLLTVPFALELSSDFQSPSVPVDQLALEIARSLLGRTAIDALLNDRSSTTSLQMQYTLAGGSDGDRPSSGNYTGDPNESTAHDYLDDPLQRAKNGLLAFEAVEDISIVAAPGYSTPYQGQAEQDRVFAIHGAVIDHCEKMRYRIAVLDTPPNQLVSEALAFRNLRSSKYASLYYPWIVVADPLSDGRLKLPPSGSIAGIYARNDIEHAVFKAPANEVVHLAIDFEQRLNKAQQEVLNPEGVNCLRFFSGHGFLVWGARTISDDPEWKYVNLRRYFAYLEHSIDRGTQWVVFENNSQQLWNNVRHTVEDFLLNEWKMGALMGSKPEEAYFVRCDLSTMTQNDLDNGRLICLIGVAAVRPAEFVIFRIGQWTATANR